MSLLKPKKTTRLPTALEERSMIGDRLGFAASEAYKLLRANLMFSLPDEKQCRVIGLTSAMRGEGKSTTSINLAYALAAAGKKTLLMEVDLRLPNIARRLGLPAAPGLSNLLVGLNTGTEVLQKSGIQENLYVITAGDIPPNPSELLGSEQMEITVNVLAKDFHFILFDLPPVNTVSDALVVSKLLHGMIMVVRQNYNNKHELSEAMRHLKLMETKVLGFVMTQGAEKEHRYKKYGYGDNYGYGYGAEQQKGPEARSGKTGKRHD